MRAVFDTVVLVRAFINPHSRWGRLLFEHSDRYDLVVSPPIVREILDVLHRSSLRDRFPQIDDIAVDRAIGIIETADIVEPGVRLAICRDPHDDKFFECAVAGDARYIVSEDNDVLAVCEYEGVRTISAAAFLEIISVVSSE